MKEIIFRVRNCLDTGGFVAHWDDPYGEGITAQSESFPELDAMILNAVRKYFLGTVKPQFIRLHFVEDPVLAL